MSIKTGMSNFTGKDLQDWFDSIEKETPEEIAGTLNREITGVFDWETLKWYTQSSDVPTKNKRKRIHPYRIVKLSRR